MAEAIFGEIGELILFAAGYKGAGKEQQEATKLLEKFPEHESCWEVSGQLLQHENPHFQFFGANFIYKKIKMDWQNLGGEERSELRSSLWNMLISTQSQQQLIANKLSLTLIATAMFAKGDITNLISETVRGCPSSMTIETAVSLLGYIPEEVETADISYSRRDECKDEVKNCHVEICNFLQSIMESINPEGDILRAISTCIGKFSALGLSAGDLLENHRSLFEHLLTGFGSDDESVFAQTCEMWEALADVSSYPMPDGHSQGLKMLIDGCLSMKDSPVANGIIGKPAFASLLATTMDQYMSEVCNGNVMGGVMVLAQLFGDESVSVSQKTISFWVSLQDEPVDQRHPDLGHPLYVQLLHTALQQCTLPNTDSFDSDFEMKKDFRKAHSGLEDLLISIYFLLNDKYLSSIMDWLNNSTDPLKVESALFVVQCVGRELNTTLKVNKSTSIIPIVHLLLNNALQVVASNQQPHLCAQICTFIRQLAAFIALDENLLQSSFAFILQVLVTENHNIAADSFSRLCTACRNGLQDTAMFRSLCVEVNSSIDAGLPTDDIKAVVAGLSRVAANDQSQAKGLCRILLESRMERLTAALNGVKESISSISNLSKELQSMAAALRFFQFRDQATALDVNIILRDQMWPLVTSTLELCLGNDNSVDISLIQAICAMAQCLIKCSPYLLHGHGHMVFELVSKLFCKQPLGEILHCLNALVENVNEQSDWSAFGQPLQQICAKLFSIITEFGANSDEAVPILPDFFDFLLSLWMFWPQILTVEILEPLLQICNGCIDVPHQPTAKSLSRFLKALLSRVSMHSHQAFRDNVIGALHHQGESLVWNLLNALAVKALQGIVPILADVCFQIMTLFENQAIEWFKTALGNPEFANLFTPGMKESRKQELTSAKEQCLHFAIAFASPPQIHRLRFKSVLKDFAGICRGQQTVDVMLSYQIAKAL